jgi:hypothetical protein
MVGTGDRANRRSYLGGSSRPPARPKYKLSQDKTQWQLSSDAGGLQYRARHASGHYLRSNFLDCAVPKITRHAPTIIDLSGYLPLAGS